MTALVIQRFRIIWVCLYTTSVSANIIQSRTFSKVMSSGVTLGPQRLSVGWSDNSVTSCVSTCMVRYGSSCRSVMYNPMIGLCTPGKWLSQTEAAPTAQEGNLYADHYCDTTDGFSQHAYGDAPACLLYITYHANYYEAENFCQARNSYMVTMKSVDKLQLLRQLVQSPFFIGLTDRVTEGKFLWADDGQEIDPSLIPLIFFPGEPSWEDCPWLQYRSGYPDMMLNDVSCFNGAKFACERPLLFL